MNDRDGDSTYDEDLFDAVAAVIGYELVAQFGLRRSPRDMPAMLADELLRRFDIRGEALDDVPSPEDWDRWPVIRHVSVDRSNRAHIELSTFPVPPESAHTIEWELPDRGRIGLTLASDGSVQEITLWPASLLLPPDVHADHPEPTTAADDLTAATAVGVHESSSEIAHAITQVLPLPDGGFGARCRCGWFETGPHNEGEIELIARAHAETHRR